VLLADKLIRGSVGSLNPGFAFLELIPKLDIPCQASSGVGEVCEPASHSDYADALGK